jgi:hypothetical protein
LQSCLSDKTEDWGFSPLIFCFPSSDGLFSTAGGMVFGLRRDDQGIGEGKTDGTTFSIFPSSDPKLSATGNRAGTGTGAGGKGVLLFIISGREDHGIGDRKTVGSSLSKILLSSASKFPDSTEKISPFLLTSGFHGFGLPCVAAATAGFELETSALSSS